MARAGIMFDKTIQSTFLQEAMLLKIYQPENVDAMHETNICIMQDGDDYFQMGRVATLSDKLHDDYEITNTYFVGIHYIDRFDRLRKYHPAGEQYEAYMQFLTEEVVPLLEELVPINPLGMKWSLIGDSLAGTIALLTAINHSDIFDNVLMQSPLVNETVLEVAEQMNGLRIYHSIGLDEENVATTKKEGVDFLTPNRALHEIIKEKITDYYYEENELGNHTWKYWQQELPHALALLLG